MPAASQACLFVLNGPNLNLLGEREPEIYGTRSLADLERACREEAATFGVDLVFRQTNAEHELVEWVQEARASSGIAINPAGFGYSSHALLDALLLCTCPIVEVHLSNIHARAEAWRGKTLTGAAASGTISGLGISGYGAAIRYLAARAGCRAA